jgi:hypothetical protein
MAELELGASVGLSPVSLLSVTGPVALALAL